MKKRKTKDKAPKVLVRFVMQDEVRYTDALALLRLFLPIVLNS